MPFEFEDCCRDAIKKFKVKAHCEERFDLNLDVKCGGVMESSVKIWKNLEDWKAITKFKDTGLSICYQIQIGCELN